MYIAHPTGALWGTNFELQLDKASMKDAILDGDRSLVTHFLKDEESRRTQDLGASLRAAIWQEDAGLVRVMLEAKANPNEVCGNVQLCA